MPSRVELVERVVQRMSRREPQSASDDPARHPARHAGQDEIHVRDHFHRVCHLLSLHITEGLLSELPDESSNRFRGVESGLRPGDRLRQSADIGPRLVELGQRVTHAGRQISRRSLRDDLEIDHDQSGAFQGKRRPAGGSLVLYITQSAVQQAAGGGDGRDSHTGNPEGVSDGLRRIQRLPPSDSDHGTRRPPFLHLSDSPRPLRSCILV